MQHPVGYYGFHGEDILTENDPPGTDFLASLAADWEREALADLLATKRRKYRSAGPPAGCGKKRGARIRDRRPPPIAAIGFRA